jgi:hypothetical protein
MTEGEKPLETLILCVMYKSFLSTDDQFLSKQSQFT